MSVINYNVFICLKIDIKDISNFLATTNNAE